MRIRDDTVTALLHFCDIVGARLRPDFCVSRPVYVPAAGGRLEGSKDWLAAGVTGQAHLLTGDRQETGK